METKEAGNNPNGADNSEDEYEHITDDSMSGYGYEETYDTKYDEPNELYDLKKEKTEEIKWDIPIDPNRYETIERNVFLSFAQKFRRDEIIKKGEEISLTVEIKGDLIKVKGPKITVDGFLSSLYDIEAEAKKKLYPKYWDLRLQEHMELINIPQDSLEFAEIIALFLMTMPTCVITKLERVQNRYLMEHYLNMLQNLHSMRPEQRLTRMLLFYGTKNTDPSEIYASFDMGFDLQYVNADQYGRGFYFAIDAKSSHPYAYKTNNNTYKLLIVDVLVGKFYQSGPAPKLIKPPKGYDSVKVLDDNVFIIYSNFRC
mgnify:CR=1 FL=1